MFILAEKFLQHHEILADKKFSDIQLTFYTVLSL